MSLIAVSASSNRSKSDRDPNDWMPTNSDYKCEYAVSWTQVKSRWSLSIDADQKKTLLGFASECANEKLGFSPREPVGIGSTAKSSPSAAPSPSNTPSPTPPQTPSASSTPSPSATQGASGCRTSQVDINTASIEELMRIKRISTARAPDVVSSRPYTSLDQLTRVKGIAAGRLAGIKAEGIACVG